MFKRVNATSRSRGRRERKKEDDDDDDDNDDDGDDDDDNDVSERSSGPESCIPVIFPFCRDTVLRCLQLWCLHPVRGPLRPEQL